MDRLVIKQILGNEQVTIYYVISLIGKTLVLLIAPINTIVISYLTKRRELLNRSQFGKAVLAGGGVAGVFFLGCQVGTPLFVWLFYHDPDSRIPSVPFYNSGKNGLWICRQNLVFLQR